MKNRFIHLATLLGFAAFASVSHADNSISTAIRISPSGVAPGLAINRAGDVDFYRLDFSSPGRFTVFSEGRTDTFGCLLNSSGGFLACNDDVSSSNLNFSITHEVSPGTFYVFVRHYSRTGTGAYSLRTQFVPSPPVDPEGNTIATALGLTMSNNAASHNGAINTAGDVDMFAVTIPAAGFLNAFSGGTTDVVGRVLNASGTQLAENDDISSTNRNFAMRTPINAGTYFVEVRHFGRTSTGAYGINVGFEPASYTGNTSLRALVVGISDYRTISDLGLCDDDARAISSVLTTSGWNVTTLIDSQASKQSIQQNIARLAPGGGRFLLYFSGHGTASDTTGYFCPWDSSNLASMISESELNAWLDLAGNATSVGVVLDSCNSGAFIGRSSAVAPNNAAVARYYQVPGAPVPDPRAGEFMSRNISQAGRVVISGCRGTQYSYEMSNLGHGWLTFQLLSGFRDRLLDTSGNGWISLEEAFVRAAPGLSVGSGNRQDPQLHDGNGSAHLDASRL